MRRLHGRYRPTRSTSPLLRSWPRTSPDPFAPEQRRWKNG
jgi:hypothetical protein